MSDLNKCIIEPFEYMTNVPGKNIRSKMISIFQEWLDADKSITDTISEIVAILHNASLMIDDIEDNSKLRRGVPVTHSIYGIPSTINSANLEYFIALQKVIELKNPQAVEIFTNELILLHIGQGKDIYWRDNMKCPTEEEYIQMVQEKTGGLFRLSLELLQLFSSNKNDFIPLINNISIFFQIRDDYINLCSKEYQQQKSFCEDITEGKFSFPIIYAIHQNPQDNRLINILKQRTNDISLKKYFLDVVNEYKGLEYTRQKLDQLYDEIKKDIHALGGNQALEGVVTMLYKTMDS